MAVDSKEPSDGDSRRPFYEPMGQVIVVGSAVRLNGVPDGCGAYLAKLKDKNRLLKQSYCVVKQHGRVR